MSELKKTASKWARAVLIEIRFSYTGHVDLKHYNKSNSFHFKLKGGGL